MSQGKREMAPQPAAQGTAVYLVVGARHVHAAIDVKGKWQSSATVDMFSDGNSPVRQTNRVSWQGALQALSAHLLSGAPDKPPVSLVGKRVVVVVAEQWLPSETIAWQAALASGDLQSAVVTRMQTVDSGVLVRAVVRCEEAGWSRARWAVAYPAELMQVLEQFAQSLGARLASVMPMACLVLQQLQRQRQTSTRRLYAYSEASTLNFVEVERGRVLSVLQRPTPPSTNPNGPLEVEAVERMWRSLQLRTPHWAAVGELLFLAPAEAVNENEWTVDTGLKLVTWPPCETGVTSPLLPALRNFQATSHPLNAIAAGPRAPVFQMVLLTLISVALGLLAWKLTVNARALKQTTPAERLAETNRVSGTPKPLTKMQQEQVVATNAAVRQLNLPAGQILQALKPPQDMRVALLGIDMSDSSSGPSTAKVKVNAETRTGEEMTQYVAFLTNRKPFTQVYLVRHEVMQKMPDSPWRFTLELMWQP